MLVAIAGSQGAGKSTIITELEQQGYPVIKRKTSRSILKEWGLPLGTVNNTPELLIKFQNEISKRKYEDEKEAIESSDIWFTERTHTDVFVYALIAVGKDNEYSDWINDYYKTCFDYNKHYSKVFYVKGGLFQVEHDGVRGSNKHYSTMTDLIMSYYMEKMTRSDQLFEIDQIDLDLRVSKIIQELGTIIGVQ